jgi:hypothetical protein
MTDTIRSLADILANLLQDGQPDLSITEQRMRDVALSLANVYATTQSGSSYTAALVDMSTLVRMTSGSACSALIPTNAAVPFPVGAVVKFRRVGAGPLTFAAVTPGTTTLIASAAPGAVSFTAGPVGSLVTFTKSATDTWYVDGDLQLIDLPFTLVALSVSTVTTGGTAVTAIAAGNRARGGFITNPSGAPGDLIVNELTTASGTVSAGSNLVISAGQTYEVAPSPLGVSVISASSGHVFAGLGRT